MLNQQVLDFIARREASGAQPPDSGIAVAVLKEGDVILSGTYGLRERDRELPVTPDTIFEIGSLTKAFTSTALMMASEQGHIELNQPINAKSPLLVLGDADVSRQISIADALSHRSGFPAHDLRWYFGSLENDALFRSIEKLETFPKSFRKDFGYSNLIYGALGRLFDVWTGESWESYVSRRILTPLKLDSTTFRPTDGERDIALPYVGTQRVKRFDMSAIAAAGGMRSTLHDMTRWLAFQLECRPHLSADSLALMQSKQISAANVNPILLRGLEWLGSDLGYGFGWFVGSAHDLKVVFHPSIIDGFSAAVAIVPEYKLAIVVLMNVNLSDSPGLLIQELMEAVLNDKPLEVAPPDARDLAVVGNYENPAYGKVAVEYADGRLVLVYQGNRWPLIWKGANSATFLATAFGLRLPLEVEFEPRVSGPPHMWIQFSLQPQVKPQLFTRPSSTFGL